MNLNVWVTKIRQLLVELNRLDLGYPLGKNEILPPASRSLLEESLKKLNSHNSLFDFYSHCDGLNLPDVHIGYFLKSAQSLEPNRLKNEPLVLQGAISGEVITIGSTGGGGYFVMRKKQGDIYYLSGVAVHDGICDVTSSKVRPVGIHLHDFLDTLERDFRAFIEDTPHHAYIVCVP